jgi:excisionase family DNA binding protein
MSNGTSTLDLDTLLTITQARRKLNVSRATLYRLIEDGEINRTYVRGAPRIATKEVEAYIERRTIPAPRRRRRPR